MPVYEFICPHCQNIFEEWLKISETTEYAPCPKCGTQARHIISHTAFVLKGGGWYVTDYGYRKGTSEDGQPAANDSKTPPAPAANASEQGAPSTPAAASASEQGAHASPAAAAPSQPASGAPSQVPA